MVFNSAAEELNSTKKETKKLSNNMNIDVFNQLYALLDELIDCDFNTGE